MTSRLRKTSRHGVWSGLASHLDAYTMQPVCSLQLFPVRDQCAALPALARDVVYHATNLHCIDLHVCSGCCLCGAPLILVFQAGTHHRAAVKLHACSIQSRSTYCTFVGATVVLTAGQNGVRISPGQQPVHPPDRVDNVHSMLHGGTLALVCTLPAPALQKQLWLLWTCPLRRHHRASWQWH
jgi:hypothetical protein